MALEEVASLGGETTDGVCACFKCISARLNEKGGE
jgi:hypothetical protein